MPRRPPPREWQPTDRPPSLLWFLAGGMGPPPTKEQLQNWKRRDREWKESKGWDMAGNNFWKEVWRGVSWRFKPRKKKKKDEGKKGEGEGAGEGGAGEEEESGTEGGGGGSEALTAAASAATAEGAT